MRRWIGWTAPIVVVGLALGSCNRHQSGTPLKPATAVPVHALLLPTDGELPPTLSQVGVFKDLSRLRPANGLRAYDVNVSFWSDGAAKRRWIALPPGQQIRFHAQDHWDFPAGTVFVKHFELPAVTSSTSATRIETRVLIADGNGGVRGGCYRWRADGSDADLVKEHVVEPVSAAPAKQWFFPSPEDCRVCHTPAAGGVLGVTTRQLNRTSPDAGENQLVAWRNSGMFEAAGDFPENPRQLSRLAPSDDSSAPLAERARSYLDANCANCHRPGGVAGNFDARYETPPASQNLVGGPVLINLGLDHARTIAPRDVWRSVALVRLETSDGTRMPPLGHLATDARGAALLRAWIESMPGPNVLAPPTIGPKGGEFQGTARVTMSHPLDGAAIHYTLDGSLPLRSSPLYTQPLELHDPATVRARAFEDGMTQSICVQETFIVTAEPQSSVPAQ